MSEPARLHASPEPFTEAGPLRDWLASIRTAPGSAAAAGASPAWAPKLVAPAPLQGSIHAPMGGVPASGSTAHDDEIAEVVAENLMLKAKLRLEIERRDDLQAMLVQEVRDMRAHISDELAGIEDLRAERDLWKARCEALMQPLFQAPAR